jgi:hypothetical protein
MAYSGFKGIGPNGLGTSKAQPKTLSDEKLVKELEAKPSTFFRPQFKTAQDQKNINSMQAISPAKQTASQKKNLPKKIVDAIAAKSPAKKNGMKYDIKEASNQNLSAKARKNYAENAQHDSKKGYR